MTDDSEKLAALQAQIDALDAKAHPKVAPEVQANAESMSLGMRAGTELVGTIGGSALIGYGLDRWLETKPWFLIILLLLGTCAAFLNIWKTTQNMNNDAEHKKAEKP